MGTYQAESQKPAKMFLHNPVARENHQKLQRNDLTR